MENKDFIPEIYKETIYLNGKISERRYGLLDSDIIEVGSIEALALTIKNLSKFRPHMHEPFYYKNREDKTISIKTQNGIEMKVKEGFNERELYALAKLATSQKDNKMQ